MKRGKPGGSKAAGTSRTPFVLVIDDYADNREMYASFLRLSGLRVEEAGSGVEALDKALALRPDLIVMDLALPGIDGWEATRRLKSDPRTKHIVIICLTGHALADSGRRARAVGCDSFLTKPCLPHDLLAEVRRLLSGEPIGEKKRKRR